MIVESNKLQFSLAKFLSNEHNKSELIKLIAKFLRDDSQNVINCVGDADTKIVSTALDYLTVDGRNWYRVHSNIYNDVWRKKRRPFEENTVHRGKFKKPIRST